MYIYGTIKPGSEPDGLTHSHVPKYHLHYTHI